MRCRPVHTAEGTHTHTHTHPRRSLHPVLRPRTRADTRCAPVPNRIGHPARSDLAPYGRPGTLRARTRADTHYAPVPNRIGHPARSDLAPYGRPATLRARTRADTRCAPVPDPSGLPVRSGPGPERTPAPFRSGTGPHTGAGLVPERRGATGEARGLFFARARVLEDESCKRRPLAWRGRSPKSFRRRGWPNAFRKRLRKSSVFHRAPRLQNRKI